MNYTFNKDAQDHRIADQVAAAGKQIEENWDKGVSPVDLEADTDIYPKVKKLLFNTVQDLGLARITPKAFSVQGKNNKTRFRVINKNYL